MCGIDPIDSAISAAALAQGLRISARSGDVAVIPLDHHLIGHGILIFEQGSRYLETIRCLLEVSLDEFETPRVVFCSYREHDVLDDDDLYEFDLTAAWLAGQGIDLIDWFVVTARNARSIPTEFDRSTNWPK